MLGKLLICFSSIHVGLQVGYLISILLGKGIPKLLEQRSQRFPKRNCFEVEDRISALPDDLLVQILSLVPTKDAVVTMILSKRWLSVWTMLPKLHYVDIINDDINKVVSGERFFGKSDQKRQWPLRFIDESLQAHKAPVLESLAIEVDTERRVDVDVGNWIKKAVHRRVRVLWFRVTWPAEPTRLPNNLYTCDTLVSLGFSDKVLVDVPSLACLPSLKYLELDAVVYKDDDSLARLLLSCPFLKNLIVERHHQDNVKVFNIKSPVLVFLSYHYVEIEPHGAQGIEGSLVIDAPALKRIFITDYSGDSFSIENEPRLEKANIDFGCYPDYRFRTSLSSLMCLELVLCFKTLAWFSTIGYSHLMECKIILVYDLDWLEPLMNLLQNSPNLKVLLIDKSQRFIQDAEEVPLSWNQPSSVPGCLSTHLQIFEWKEYDGRNEENEFISYIFANSKCLKRAGFSLKSTNSLKDRKKMKDLESMYRVSTSSQLLFSTQLEYMRLGDETSE